MPLEGEILEPAAGTGNWTLYLARRASRVTVVDASEAMIGVNRRRLREAGLEKKVSYEKADLFEWRPSSVFDAVFLGFWLSHVPREKLDAFLGVMAEAVRPGGALALIDSRPRDDERRARQGTQRMPDDVDRRTLESGEAFRIVKRCDDPEDLKRRLDRAGFTAEAGTTGGEFLIATALRR